MNIVYLSNEYPLWAPGGVGTFLQTIGRALAAEGHMVTILGIGIDDKEVRLEDKGVQLVRLPRNKTIFPNFMYNARKLNKRLKKMHKDTAIDIIETAELGLAIISGSHPAKKVIRLHGGHHFFAESEKRGINWRKGRLEKISFATADAFIAVSNYVKEHTAKFLSYHGKPVEIINYPINTLLEIPQVDVDEDRILFAGTICEKKGVRQLIQGFKQVKEKYPQMKLDLYGRDWFFPDGSSYIEMLKQNFDASFFKDVTFHGTVEREMLNVKYAEAAFCVFPSHMETQGLVSLEAMLLEKPVIFSEYGPGPETIEHGVTGLLCDVYNPDDIAEKMMWCVENREEARQLGVAAREKVLKKYNLNAIVARNVDFYNTLKADGKIRG